MNATGELIALARTIGENVTVGLIGDRESGADAVAMGADRVYVLSGQALRDGGRDAQLQAYETLCKKTKAAAILLSKTDSSSELGPRLAARMDVALAQDCTAIHLGADGDLTATRPVYGGNAVAKFSFPRDLTSIVILRAKSSEPKELDRTRSGEVIEMTPNIDPELLRVKSIKTIEEPAAGIRLEDATVVVSGGRGLGGPEPFDQLQDLAKVLGGAVGASRAACDAGWIDHAFQVGLTGKTITPNLYIAVGISGASQHMAGCSGAKNVVAINSDESANIFKDSRYGVVGDWKAILPAFMATLEELYEQ